MMKNPDPIGGLAKECVAFEDASSVETPLDVLEKAGIAKRFRVHPEAVAVAENNRDDYGVAPADVSENATDICISKWHDLIFKGVLTDLSGDAFDKACNFNQDLADGSPTDRSKIQFKALRGNRTS